MGKMHDKFKNKDMKRHAIINSRDVAGASIIQQTGLNTPEGMQRMFNILLHKMDPKGKGVIVTLADLQNYAETSVIHGKQNTMVYGQFDSILFKLCTDAEMANAEAHAMEVFKDNGLGNV